MGRALSLRFAIAAAASLMALPQAVAQTPVDGSPTQTQGSPNVGPALDTSMFREGAVQRFEGTFEAWRYVCDEIVSTRQRFCSMNSTAEVDDQKVEITLSTSDKGQPAAALKLPTGIYLREKVQLAFVSKADQGKKKRTASPKPQNLRILSCTEDGCHTVLPLTVKDITLLTAGGEAQLSFRQVASAPGALQVVANRRFVISGAGLQDALNATMQ